jgi:hypothetical protein
VLYRSQARRACGMYRVSSVIRSLVSGDLRCILHAGELMARRDRPRPNPSELSSLQKVAAFLEQSRLGSYVDLMNRPWRLIWLNFLAGLARGVGIFVGGGLVGALLLLILVRVLKETLSTLGGLPWVGAQLEELIGWVLNVVEQQKRQP